jgi:hypothetical protein
MTRADLAGEVYQAIGIPLKESDIVVCAIFDSIVRALRSGDKVEIRGFGSFPRAKDEGALDAIKDWSQSSTPKRIPSSRWARNSAD